MTISQSSSSQGSGRLPLASWGRTIGRALACWRERRRAKADLARLAEAGDHLLQDVGLDPALARENPGALAEQVMRRDRVSRPQAGGGSGWGKQAKTLTTESVASPLPTPRIGEEESL